MTTNHPRGGVSSSSGRSQGKRQKNAPRPAAPLVLERGRPDALTAIGSSPLDGRPGGDPLVVGDAILTAIRAGGDRRLPEVDGIEVRARRVRVVLRAGTRLQRLHLRAGLGVDGRLAEEEGLLGLDL